MKLLVVCAAHALQRERKQNKNKKHDLPPPPLSMRHGAALVALQNKPASSTPSTQHLSWPSPPPKEEQLLPPHWPHSATQQTSPLEDSTPGSPLLQVDVLGSTARKDGRREEERESESESQSGIFRRASC